MTKVAPVDAPASTPRFRVAVPVRTDALYGELISPKEKTSGNKWIERALDITDMVGIESTDAHAFRAGMVDLAPGIAAQVVVVLGCKPEGRLCDCADALGVLRSVQPTPLVVWCTLGALHALPAFGIVEMAAARATLRPRLPRCRLACTLV